MGNYQPQGYGQQPQGYPQQPQGYQQTQLLTCTPSGCQPSMQPLQAKCPYFHSADGFNYMWLAPIYGKVVKAEFNEKNQGWINYEQLHSSTPGTSLHNWWIEHCQSVSHDINNLYTSHVATFVTPETRTIVMRLTFDNGRVYQSDVDTATFMHFFQIEESYAKYLFTGNM